jgi:hypothetical protein
MRIFRIKYLILANIYFVLHSVVVFIVIFGWFFEGLHTIYVLTLFLTLFSELYFGYCILTKLEFESRRKISPKLSYDFSFMSYYVYKLFKFSINQDLLRNLAFSFLIISLICSLY